MEQTQLVKFLEDKHFTKIMNIENACLELMCSFNYSKEQIDILLSFIRNMRELISEISLWMISRIDGSCDIYDSLTNIIGQLIAGGLAPRVVLGSTNKADIQLNIAGFYKASSTQEHKIMADIYSTVNDLLFSALSGDLFICNKCGKVLIREHDGKIDYARDYCYQECQPKNGKEL